jgi:hypothetical protein
LVTCILFTVRGSSPNRRAAARSLRPSIRTAWRTRPYSSTPFIPALCQSSAKGYLLPDFYSGGTATASAGQLEAAFANSTAISRAILAFRGPF